MSLAYIGIHAIGLHICWLCTKHGFAHEHEHETKQVNVKSAYKGSKRGIMLMKMRASFGTYDRNVKLVVFPSVIKYNKNGSSSQICSNNLSNHTHIMNALLLCMHKNTYTHTKDAPKKHIQSRGQDLCAVLRCLRRLWTRLSAISALSISRAKRITSSGISSGLALVLVLLTGLA